MERVRDWQAAAEVVQRVFLRLATELAAGETDRGPYRNHRALGALEPAKQNLEQARRAVDDAS